MTYIVTVNEQRLFEKRSEAHQFLRDIVQAGIVLVTVEYGGS